MGHRNTTRQTPTEQIGSLPLTSAKLIVHLEALLSAFALPLAVLALFIGLAWLGLFKVLFPWAHLLLLAIFVLWFFVALSKAKLVYRRPTLSTARRRIENINHLRHRPLDVLDDRPAFADETQRKIWELHRARSRAEVRQLRLPRWQLSFAQRDPYALRYGLLVLILIGIAAGWGQWGDRLMTAINPALGQGWKPALPTMNAWITPPDYTGLVPIMIATPAGTRLDRAPIAVPAGSTLTAHLTDSKRVPVLAVGDAKQDFTTDARQNFSVTAALPASGKVVIDRGWQRLASWTIQIQPDAAPTIKFAEEPGVTERKAVKLSYQASDDYGVKQIKLVITPTMSVPGQDNTPLEIMLTEPQAKDTKQVDYQDLTGHPWAGTPVQLELVAVDALGQTGVSDKKIMTLPERVFTHPVARALIEERKKLLFGPEQTTRDEAANIMAGIARQPAVYGGDPVVLMALRGGAVRLVLDRDAKAPHNVASIMWQSALRIEDGSSGDAENQLRQAQRELSEALERKASEAEIQRLIDQVQAALQNYMRELAQRVAQQPPLPRELQQAVGQQLNMLSPDDLQEMLNEMRNLSASGKREAAQQRLEQLRQMLENLKTGPMQLSNEQQQMLRQMAELRSLTRQQQELLDKTFQANDNTNKSERETELRQLAEQQNALQKKLQELMKQPGATENLGQAGEAMRQAAEAMRQGQGAAAQQRQGEALAALQQASQQTAQQLRQQLRMIGMGSGGRPGQGRDPLGRRSPNGSMAQDDGSIKVPDRMTIQKAREILDELQRRAGDNSRPEPERDYIDRLLERF
jgi:uncharacterized protein (TIGR02302 family)